MLRGALTALLLLPVAAQAATTAIRFGTLIDGKGGVVKGAVVVLDGERIELRPTESRRCMQAWGTRTTPLHNCRRRSTNAARTWHC